ncbi:MAG: RNA polymerase sigma factor, partial [bacterium]
MTGANSKISAYEDNLWIQKYLDSRDTQYLGNLYERYKQKIFVHCLKKIKNVEEAKDLASETFIKAFDKIENFQPGSPFLPWLVRIASNLCIDHLRKSSRFRYQPI